MGEKAPIPHDEIDPRPKNAGEIEDDFQESKEEAERLGSEDD